MPSPAHHGPILLTSHLPPSGGTSSSLLPLNPIMAHSHNQLPDLTSRSVVLLQSIHFAFALLMPYSLHFLFFIVHFLPILGLITVDLECLRIVVLVKGVITRHCHSWVIFHTMGTHPLAI